MADFVARASLERGVFPSVLTPEEHVAKADYIQTMRPEVEGFLLEPGDIIIEEPERGAIPYSRVPQLRLVTKLQETNPEAFYKVLALSCSGDNESLKQLIEQTWGHNFAENIAKSDIDIRALISMVGAKMSV